MLYRKLHGLPRNRTLVIAHRGGALLWPENTLRAFAAALRLGSDVLEMDVRQSAEGVPVVIHDETVDRTTNARGPVRSFRLSELRQLDAAYRFSAIDAPGTFACRGTGVTISTLREVFQAFPRAFMLVEIKERDSALADAILQLVAEFDRDERTLLASFHHDMLRHFRGAAPAVATHASRREAAAFLAAALLFCARLINPGYELLLVPPASGGLPVLTRHFVSAAAGCGLAVGAWTINDAAGMRALARRGVWGLITDRPDLAVPIVRE
ncbi:MAG: glycerophosphodiester phosphodiesterase [Spirochaetaceae bacterium]|nr:MAG: glycerophosphodiester phosphodiesterase [Spirochaetaceae bacterium]